MNNGYISIHRKIQSHWLWDERRTFSNAEAWIDILMTVNHSDKKVLIKNSLLEVQRGESILSLDSWGKRWKWNKSKVRRFLKLLENEEMICLKNEVNTTRLTVCNYDSYQCFRNASETQVKRKRNASETQMTPNNNNNNNNNINNTINPTTSSIDFDSLLKYINSKTGRGFKVINNKVKSKYKARLKDGYSKKDIISAINNSVETKFHKDNGFNFLTPEFFSRAETIDKYATKTKTKSVSVTKEIKYQENPYKNQL